MCGIVNKDEKVQIIPFQRAGLREYWIVDPVRKDAQSFVLKDGRCAVKGFSAAGDMLKVNIPEDCAIDLTEVFPHDGTRTGSAPGLCRFLHACPCDSAAMERDFIKDYGCVLQANAV